MHISDYENYRETKTHSDPDFPYITYLCSIPLDFHDVPLHWHNEMELIYIKKGSGIVTIDFHSYQVESGDLCILLPGRIHGISTLHSCTMEYENIIFSTDMLFSKHGDALQTEFFVPFLSGKISFPEVIHAEDSFYPELSACVDRADRVCSTFEKGYKLAVKSALFDFFYVLYKHSDDMQPIASNKQIDRLKDIIKYIETNYQQPISIDEISSIMGFSSSHFMRFFKNAMGTSFIAYLNEYRLSMATRMLVSSEDAILEIASSSGFDNLSYFNRLFKKRYQMTPGVYRNTKKKGLPM